MQHGEKNYCKNTKVLAKANGQFFKSVVRLNVWMSTKLEKCVIEVE